MIGIQRLRDDIEALTKRKINSSKGGKKRAENHQKKKEEEQEEVKINKVFRDMSRDEQIKFMDYVKKKEAYPEDKLKAYENAIKPY